MRIAVFLDWQNVYREARRAFDLETAPSERGVVSPYEMARVLIRGNERGDAGELTRVEIHRGLPDSRRSGIGNRAAMRHADAWRREAPIVVPVLRPLRINPATGREEEKGVDVALAISLVERVLDDQDTCDVAILFSHDTDLSPVVDAVCRLRGADRIETASWRSATFFKQIPPVEGVYNHALRRDVFEAVERPVNYARERRRPR